MKHTSVPIGNGVTMFQESEAFKKNEEICRDSFLRITKETLEKHLSKGFGYRKGKDWGYIISPILYQVGCIFSYGIYSPANKKVFHVVFKYYKNGDEESGIPKNSWEVRFSSEESLIPTFGCSEYHESIDEALSSTLSHVQQFCTLVSNFRHHAQFSGLIKL